MPSASDPKQIKAAAKMGRRTRVQELGDLEIILQNASGRRFFWRLLESCGVFSISYTRGDQLETAFREGERNIGLKLMTDLMEAAPETYLEMRRENFEPEEEDATGRNGDAGSEQDSID